MTASGRLGRPRPMADRAGSPTRPTFSGGGLHEQRRCHDVVTRCAPRGSTGDSLRRCWLFKWILDLLRDKAIRSMSDWGSSGIEGIGGLRSVILGGRRFNRA
jgi:hypothetical protein